MRIAAMTTSGVGGLQDCTVELPEGPVVALAGSNGAGKSKFLGCLLSPWSRTLPQGGLEIPVEVRVQFELTPADWAALEDLSSASSWGPVNREPRLEIVLRSVPLVGGLQVTANTNQGATTHAFAAQEFLRRYPEFNVVYLPAERRLLPPGTSGIDLDQLSVAIAMQKNAESRNALQNYGRLDDQEFEQFAKALCIADALESDGTGEPSTRIHWPEFRSVVDSLIAPKRLVGLSRQHPESLRIEAPNGAMHAVQELSSGERQALIIMSRVLRAGAGHTLVLIDEPDAYLHPHLSRRLMQALSGGVGPDGQLIVATHSPSILDSLPPASIVRFSHSAPPKAVASEPERVALYRGAGFRASALTQSDLLVLLEGETDATLLPLVFSQLARASVRAVGGREQVIERLRSLLPFDVPVIGAVDRDVLAPALSEPERDSIAVWPTADLEGAFLSDKRVLASLLDVGVISPEFEDLTALQTLIRDLAVEQEENVVAEIAQRELRDRASDQWPSPRGERAVERLADYVRERPSLDADDVTSATASARRIWEEHKANPLTLVRGKRIVRKVTQRATRLQDEAAFLEIAARQMKDPPEVLRGFGALLREHLVE